MDRRSLRRAACSVGLAASLAAPGCGREPSGSDNRASAPDSTLGLRRRIAALEARRSFGGDALQRALHHPDARVRRAAVVALGRIQDPGALGMLRPMLADPDASVGEQAAFAIGQLQGLDDEQRHVAQSGLLERIDAQEPIELVAHVEALGKLGGQELVPILAKFVSTGMLVGGISAARPPEVEGPAALAMARVGTPDAIRILRQAVDLAGRDPSVAWHLAAALGQSPDSSLVGPLLTGLDHPHKFARALTARSLGKNHDARAVQPLLQHLSDLDWEVRASILLALGDLRREVGPEVADFCASLAGDAHPLVREAALVALDSLGAAKQVGLVRPALQDPVAAVRLAALRLLAPIERRGLREAWKAARADSVDFVRAEALRVAHHVLGAAAAAETLLARLQDGPVRDRVQAAGGLGELPEPRGPARRRAASGLQAALADADFAVVVNAALAIGTLRLGECAAALEAAYAARGSGHADLDVRMALVEAAATLARTARDRSPELRALLEKARSDPDRRIAHEAEVGLARLSGAPEPAAPRLAASLEPLGQDSLPHIDLGRVRVRLVTAHGEALLELDGDRFPRTVGNFLRLVDSGFYARGVFHRVVPAFVVQGGCPRGDGWGDPGWSIPCEYGDLRYDDAGVVGMAHAGKDTGGSQFFITHLPVPRLDGRYTAFGRVVAGMDVVNRVVRGDRFHIERLEPLAQH
jgi:cyclophilin family peptidyl-prolyl cis-trans isomerase/HEAT repeat protein